MKEQSLREVELEGTSYPVQTVGFDILKVTREYEDRTEVQSSMAGLVDYVDDLEAGDTIEYCDRQGNPVSEGVLVVSVGGDADPFEDDCQDDDCEIDDCDDDSCEIDPFEDDCQDDDDCDDDSCEIDD